MSPLRRWVLGATLVIGGCTYVPDRFRFAGVTFPAHRITAGCLDFAVGAHASFRPSEPVITYAIGNRCNDDVAVDLTLVEVWGSVADGRRMALEPADPEREIRPLQLAASWAGRASIEYLTPEPLSEVCIYVDRMLGTSRGPICLKASVATGVLDYQEAR